MGILGEVALALRLARRELRPGLRGFGVFLSCLALGVAAVAGVKSLATAYDAGLVRDASALLGGDVEVSLPLRPASVDELAALTARGHVSHVLSLRIMARRDAPGAKPTLASLRAVDAAYPLYGQVVLVPPLPLDAVLAQQDGLPGAAVSPQLLDRLGAKVGERIRLADAEFVIRAVLTREPDAAAGLAASLGPPILISSSQLAASGLSGPGLIARHAYRLKLPPGVSAAVARELREGFPEAGWRVRDASGAQPGLSRIMDRLTAIMGLVGLTALLLGGIGIAQAVASYLDGRTSSIAAMKCLGAPTRVVTWTYLTVVLTLAVGGIVPGLALGALLPALVAPLLDTVSPAALVVGLHGQAWPWPPVFGLLTVLTFSLPALAGAARIAPLSLLRGQVAADLPRLGVRVFLPAMVCALALASLTVRPPRTAGWDWGLSGRLSPPVGVFQLFGLLTHPGWPGRPRRRRDVSRGPARPGTSGQPASRPDTGRLGPRTLHPVRPCQVDANFAQALVSDIPRRAQPFFSWISSPGNLKPSKPRCEGSPGSAKLDVSPMSRGTGDPAARPAGGKRPVGRGRALGGPGRPGNHLCRDHAPEQPARGRRLVAGGLCRRAPGLGGRGTGPGARTGNRRHRDHQCPGPGHHGPGGQSAPGQLAWALHQLRVRLFAGRPHRGALHLSGHGPYRQKRHGQSGRGLVSSRFGPISRDIDHRRR